MERILAAIDFLDTTNEVINRAKNDKRVER